MNTVIDDIDYGPLAYLVGQWEGKHGLDHSPCPTHGADDTEFTDELIFTPTGVATNAQEQHLVTLRYHHVVRKLDNNCVFHDQVGHWMYDKSTQLVMHSLSIPRGLTLLAGGEYSETEGDSVFAVRASADSETFGIVQSPFMLEKASTKAFSLNLTVNEDQLSYRQVTSLHIYGKDFDHVDQSTLVRVNAAIKA